MSERWTAGRLLSRRFRTRSAASVLVAALAVFTVGVSVVVPRLVAQQATAELAFQLQAIGPAERSLQGSAAFSEDFPTSPPPELDQIYGPLQATFDATRAGYPSMLRGLVGPVSWIVQTPAIRAPQVNGVDRTVGLRLTADREYLSHIRMVQGVAPSGWTHTELEPAAQFAEHCRVQIEELIIKGLEGMTCSFGVTQLKADDDIFSFTKRVDSALYRAKAGGRNRVEKL